jgi:hypothetical protein
MLEKLLRARLPEQIVALIENLEQNPDASHLEKVLEFASRYAPDITTFEYWMLTRAVRRVRKLVKRDELLRGAMAIVINAPEEKSYDANTLTYKASGRYNLYDVEKAQLMHHAQKAQQAQQAGTWVEVDPKLFTSNRSLF